MRNNKIFIALALLIVVLCTAALAVPQESGDTGERKALVIGNIDYPEAPLRNCVNDARAMKDALKRLGFEVTEVAEDANLVSIEWTVKRFAESLRPGDVALFFYSGHGFQIEGKNYLVPTDFVFANTDEIIARHRSYAVPILCEYLEESQSRLNIIILDACRNNPFRRSRGGDRGLAAMSAGKGTFLAFATGPNQIASDNTAGQTSDNTAGQNGLFTNYLLMEMQKPGLKIEEVFKRVGRSVSEASRGAQNPCITSSWYGDFYFIQPRERTFGTLRVTVNAEGAEISLIGQEKNIHTWSRGAETINFPDIPAGKYELSISKQGYESDYVGREVEVLDGQTTTLLVNLVPENPEPVGPALGAIRLSLNTSDPDGILLDGSPTQPIKLSERLYEIRDVPVGDHTIEIIKSGYLPSPFRSIASVSVGETTTARVELRTVRDALTRVEGLYNAGRYEEYLAELVKINSQGGASLGIILEKADELRTASKLSAARTFFSKYNELNEGNETVESRINELDHMLSHGDILIRCSNVADALIEVKGITDGKGQVELKGLAVGQYAVSITHEQYEAKEFSVNVKSLEEGNPHVVVEMKFKPLFRYIHDINTTTGKQKEGAVLGLLEEMDDGCEVCIDLLIRLLEDYNHNELRMKIMGKLCSLENLPKERKIELFKGIRHDMKYGQPVRKRAAELLSELTSGEYKVDDYSKNKGINFPTVI